MAPKRNNSQRNSASSPKPYSRSVTPTATSNTPSQDLTLTQTSETAPSFETQPEVQSLPGFPTYAQYKHMERVYLDSLTPRRKGKALISQALFDRIWDVLHQPDSSKESAQFRFWARKMFSLSKIDKAKLGLTTQADEPSTQVVILHENLLVAIQEQIYDLLCYCHGTTNHAGRDKTYTLIRKHYTWVPKDLISQFVRACPTCLLKKCGKLDLDVLAVEDNSDCPSEGDNGKASPPLLREYLRNLATKCTTSADIDKHSTLPGSPLDETEVHTSHTTLEACLDDVQNGPTHPHLYPPCAGKHVMRRETSLYRRDLQFFTDQEEARAAYVKSQEEALTKRIDGKIPMVMCIVVDDDFSDGDRFEGDATAETGLPACSSSPTPSAEDNALEDEDFNARIDPTLLAASKPQLNGILLSSQSHPPVNEALHVSFATPDDLETLPVQTSPIPVPRAPAASPASPRSQTARHAVPSLNLTSLESLSSLSSLMTYEALLESRDAGNDLPDSPLSSGHSSTSPSPSPSYSNFRSGMLAVYPLDTHMQMSESISPAESALPTPMDEVGKGLGMDILGKDLADTAGELSLNSPVHAF